MIAYDEALRRLLAEVDPLDIEAVELPEADGRFCAREVRSPAAVPAFPNSAMDGFALATGGGPVPEGRRCRVAGSVAAGDSPPEAAGGDAWEIMTGAPVPAGLDAVVPVEQVDVEERVDGEPRRIRLRTSIEPGQNVRPAGKDFAPGDRVVEAGRRIGPAERMALAAVGVPRIEAFVRPAVRILCTGPELVDEADRPLGPGQIRNSNGPFLSSYLARRGARVTAVRTLDDREGPFLAELERAAEDDARIVVSTGAVSMGRHDFVPRAVERAGGRVLFHRVAIRPGKPHFAAVLPGGALFLGLPGNPISAVVGARFFLEPALRRARGMGPEAPWRLPLADDVGRRADLRFFLRATLEARDDGSPAVRVLPAQQSFRIAPLLDARAWVVLPPGPERALAGERVAVHGLYEELPRNVVPGTG